MSGKKTQCEPTNDWKIDILEREIESQRDMLGSLDPEDDPDEAEFYTLTREVIEGLEQWVSDIKDKSRAPLSKDELNIRIGTVEEIIQYHKDILAHDDSLSFDIREEIGEDIEKLNTWKKELRSKKKAGC